MISFYPPVIAHRGVSSEAPENTLIAFTKAAQQGIRWLEFDVMLSACGRPVIFHDDLLERTTNGKGELEAYSFDYLRGLDAGSWFDIKFAGEKIPSLHQVIDFLSTTGLSANVEIKSSSPLKEEILVKCVLEEMAPFLAQTSATILFSSFSINALHLLRQYAPTALLGLLLHDWREDWPALCEQLNCVSVHLNDDIVTPDLVKEIKMRGKSALVYTVNEVARAKYLQTLGVDAVFSDVPSQIAKALSLS